MIFPSIASLILWAAAIAVLAVVDWYVWRIAPGYPLSPAGMRDAESDEKELRKVALFRTGGMQTKDEAIVTMAIRVRC